MSQPNHRYRLTVTPIEDDGQPCQGRSTIEFEHRCHDNWMRLLEAMQGQPGFSGDQRAALVVGTKLLSGIMLQHRQEEGDLFAALRPHMGQFIKDLQQRSRAA